MSVAEVEAGAQAQARAQPSAHQPAAHTAAQLLEQHFDTAFAAPDGLPRLRELILTLAMQGKLTNQDPSDPPAAELLADIEQEKRRLVAAGQIKAPKPLPPIEADEKPYELPQGWAWVRLDNFGIWKSGSTPSRNNSAFYDGDIAWVKSGEVKQGKITTTEETITQLALDSCSLNINPSGSVLIAMYGANIGEVGVLEIEATTNQAVCACQVFSGVSGAFLIQLLSSLKQDFILQGAGAAQPNISKEKIIHTLVPLPPLPEQRRIVARIDQLMARCDELQALRTAQQHKRLHVHAAALSALLGAGGPDDFAEAWQFVAQHFDGLYSVPENVAELRKAVLQLAVMGKLVPQDPTDPPARELLKDIEAEKRRLVAEKKIKAPKPLPPVKPEDRPYEVPEGWEWVRLGEVSSKVTDGDHQTPPRIAEGCRLLSAKNVRDGYLDFSNCDAISQEDYQKSRERCMPEEGDLLIVSVGGTIGRSSLVPTESDFALVRSVALVKPLLISSEYLKHSMDSTLLQDAIRANKRGGAQPCLYLSEIERLIFSLPPLPEQRRIVARIDQFMALCGALEARLSAQANTQSALLNSLMDAVTPARPAPTLRPRPARPAASAPANVAQPSPVRGRGRPRKTNGIPTADSMADAIQRLEALKLERAQGSRQPSLFDPENQ